MRGSLHLVAHIVEHANFVIEKKNQVVQGVPTKEENPSGENASCMSAQRTKSNTVVCVRAFHATFSQNSLIQHMDKRAPLQELDSWRIVEEPELKNTWKYQNDLKKKTSRVSAIRPPSARSLAL